MKNAFGWVVLVGFMAFVAAAPFMKAAREKRKEAERHALASQQLDRGNLEDAYEAFMGKDQGSVETDAYQIARGFSYHPNVQQTLAVYVLDGQESLVCFEKKTDGKWYADAVDPETEAKVRANMKRSLDEWLTSSVE